VIQSILAKLTALRFFPSPPAGKGHRENRPNKNLGVSGVNHAAVTSAHEPLNRRQVLDCASPLALSIAADAPKRHGSNARKVSGKSPLRGISPPLPSEARGQGEGCSFNGRSRFSLRSLSQPVLFAAVGGIDLPASSKVPGLVASDLILIIGLGTLIFGGIITWVVFVRGPRKHPSEKRSMPKITLPVTITDDGRERHRKKKRVRRRTHRQRNPTLTQTGGFPPPRAEDTPAAVETPAI
jgi:hypothetical protein